MRDTTFEMLKEAMLLRGWQYKEQLPPYAKGEMPYMFVRCVDCSGEYYADCWASNNMIDWFHDDGEYAPFYLENGATIDVLYSCLLKDLLHWHVTYQSHHLGGNAVILAATRGDAIQCTCEGLNLANDIGVDAKVINLHLNKPVEIFNGDY